MSDDVVITVRVNNATGPGITGVNATINRLNNAARNSNNAMKDWKATLLSLAPAAVPVAAALAPIAVHAGAATLAVGAFTAAVVPQIKSFKDVSDAQTKYADQSRKTGAASQQAIKAQQAYLETLNRMPMQTRRAAVAFQDLGSEYKQWSDSLSGFTMVPVERSFAVLGAVIPKLTPMVQGASTQLNRLVTVAGGAVNTQGFDVLSKKVSDFANNSLKKATDGAIHFARVLSEGNASGPIASFMDYAREQGPAVKELFVNLTAAVSNLLEGAAQAGPGLMSLVNAFAKLVASVPPSLVGNLMQVYAAFKLIKLAGAGIGAAAGGIQTLGTRIAALQAASAAAGGGVAGLRAAFLSLGTAAKATVVVAGITLLVVALSKLSSIGKQAPPDIDRMTTAMGRLGDTGKVTGEAARVFGKDLSGLADSLHTLAKPTGLDKTQQFLTSLIGMDSTPVKKAKEDFDSIDKALTNLVKGGKPELAKAALDDVIKSLQKQGYTSKQVMAQLDDYKSALADQALEAKLTAESQGLFGAQAQKVAAQLDTQKASADGLRQSIVALNDVNRQGLGGMIGFEAAIDAASKAAKDNAGALSMHNGVLNLNSEKARNAATALQDLADKTDAAGTAQREAGASWETVNGIYSRGSAELVKQAQAMGLSKEQAQALAKQLLTIPSQVVSKVAMNTEDATRDLDSFNAAVRRAPGAKSVTLKTLSSAAEQVLKAFGYKVQHLPNGSVKISAAAGGALSAIRSVAGAIASLHDRHITLTTEHRTIYTGGGGRGPNAGFARGGPVRGYAGGGGVQSYPDGGYVEGPGSGTSDSIVTMLGSGNVVRTSNTEFIVNAQQTRKHRRLLELINAGQLPKFASGGLTQSMKDARAQLRSSFGISSFGRIAGYSRTPFEKSLGAPTDVNALVSSLNEAAGRIKAAFSGRTESSLLRQLSSVGKSLINYDKQLTKVTSSLASASSKLTDLKNSAAQLKDSVKSNILSGANVTRSAGSDDSQVTINTLLSQARGDTAQAQQFASSLAALKKKGLSGNILEQVASAGVSGGGLETARALLGASSGQIGELNTLNHNLRVAADAAGGTAADSMYGAAIKAQEKLVNSLKAQQAKLEKAMANLAKVMEKAISRATGKAAGGIVGAAASGGVRGGLTWVGEHEPELLDLPVGSRVWSGPDSRRKLAAAQAPWASMMTTRRAPSSGRAAGASAAAVAGGRPIVVQLQIGNKQLGEIVIDPLREAVAARGGNVQATLGRG